MSAGDVVFRRILAVAAQDALVQAARELLDTGMQEFWKRALRSVRTVKDALRDS